MRAGTLDGHVDCLDCVGCLTTMMAMSRLPEGYEAGRFHLLALGVYARLDFMKILVFCGLNKHGGTPPIAPPGQLIVMSPYEFTSKTHSLSTEDLGKFFIHSFIFQHHGNLLP